MIFAALPLLSLPWGWGRVVSHSEPTQSRAPAVAEAARGSEPGAGRNGADLCQLFPRSGFSQTLLEHRHRQQQSCPLLPSPRWQQDGKQLGVVFILQGGGPGEDLTLVASRAPVPPGCPAAAP